MHIGAKQANLKDATSQQVLNQQHASVKDPIFPLLVT
jgi:hypothetical protein